LLELAAGRRLFGYRLHNRNDTLGPLWWWFAELARVFDGHPEGASQVRAEFRTIEVIESTDLYVPYLITRAFEDSFWIRERRAKVKTQIHVL
jgi:hypothetical protein